MSRICSFVKPRLRKPIEFTPAYDIGSRAALHMGNVFVDQSPALYHHMRTYMAKLMNQCSSSNYRKIVDLYLSSNLRSVCNNDIVPNHAVMGDVRISHNKAIAANNSLALRRGAPVYGHAFTNGCVVANDSQRVFSPINLRS